MYYVAVDVATNKLDIGTPKNPMLRNWVSIDRVFVPAKNVGGLVCFLKWRVRKSHPLLCP